MGSMILEFNGQWFVKCLLVLLLSNYKVLSLRQYTQEVFQLLNGACQEFVVTPARLSALEESGVKFLVIL